MPTKTHFFDRFTVRNNHMAVKVSWREHVPVRVESAQSKAFSWNFFRGACAPPLAKILGILPESYPPPRDLGVWGQFCSRAVFGCFWSVFLCVSKVHTHCTHTAAARHQKRSNNRAKDFLRNGEKTTSRADAMLLFVITILNAHRHRHRASISRHLRKKNICKLNVT